LVAGGLLAIAVAMALSSVPITATLVILLSPRRRQSSLPFLTGWVLTIAVVALAAAGGALAIPGSRRERLQVAAATQIVIGLGLLVGAIVTLRRSRTRESKPNRRWEALGSSGPAASFGVALLMGVRPKALLLGIAAGFALGTQPLRSTRTVLAFVLYVVVSASSVAVPIVGTLLSPEAMEPRLLIWRDWLSRNGIVVAAWVVMVIGLVLVVTGVSNV
jgi:hypothetical protein